MTTERINWLPIAVDHWIATINGKRASLKLWPQMGWCLASVDHKDLAMGRTFKNPRTAALYAIAQMS